MSPSATTGVDGARSLEHDDVVLNDLNLNQQEEPTTAAAAEPESDEQLFSFRFEVKCHSLMSIHNHWMGRGDCADDPFGGCQGRNAKCGKKWREKAEHKF